MNRHYGLKTALLATAVAIGLHTACADPAGTKTLLDTSKAPDKRLVPTSDQVTLSRSPDAAAPGILVTIQPGKESYPGVAVKPEGASWDLSAYGHVEARIVNTGTKDISVALRVDNAGNWQDNPWNTESVYLKPGAAGTVTTIFGYSYGRKPGYKLNPAAVVQLLIFAQKSDAVQSFRIESVRAAGPAHEQPPIDPESIRIQPPNGFLLGPGASIDPAKQITASGAQASLVATGDKSSLRISFPGGSGTQSATLKPTVGRWDLRNCLELRTKVRNAGNEPITPRIRLESNGGPTDWGTTTTPLAPGADAEVVVPFIAAAVWNGEPGTGNHLASDACSAVTISAEPGQGERTLLVESVRADMPPVPVLPDWLGKRPPIPGNWKQTFDDEFSGSKIDATKWNVTGENYYDKLSHYSKENVIVGGGVARLRYQKKKGYQNDDPKRNQTDYATGFLDTYGKWTQRDGYFEARMKLPPAPGLWPAFWMMPDRGPASDPQWKRQDTANGGMEFDIMEHLTRWGPTRYNIAMHYDGYGKDHKSTGSDRIYVQPDKDGFITCGLLWTPGNLTFYCNGLEVLEWKNPRVSIVPSDIMFTLPMGGWDNNSLDDTKLPSDFIIDYVRAWQRDDLAAARA